MTTSPTILTIHPGSLSNQELLDAVASEVRYDTYIRYNNVLLTTMFREPNADKVQYSAFISPTGTMDTIEDLGSLDSFVSYLKRKIAYSSIAVKSGIGVSRHLYDQPLPRMGGVTLNDLTQDVMLKLFRSQPKIITKSYLMTIINSVGIDHIRRAKVRIVSVSDFSAMDNTDSLSSFDAEMLDTYRREDMLSTLVLNPDEDLEFNRMIDQLTPIEQKIIIGRMYNERSEDIAGYSGICRRQVFIIIERLRLQML